MPDSLEQQKVTLHYLRSLVIKDSLLHIDLNNEYGTAHTIKAETVSDVPSSELSFSQIIIMKNPEPGNKSPGRALEGIIDVNGNEFHCSTLVNNEKEVIEYCKQLYTLIKKKEITSDHYPALTCLETLKVTHPTIRMTFDKMQGLGADALITDPLTGV